MGEGISSEQHEEDEHRLLAERRNKLTRLREAGVAFPNDFRRDSLSADLHQSYDALSREVLTEQPVVVSVAGRMKAKRVMGKASFIQLQDMAGVIQLYADRKSLSDEVYDACTSWDVGDILGASGSLFKTKTGELTVRVETLRLLTKSLRPLPEKYHGLADTELRYRKRYLDLIMNAESRQVFALRNRIIRFIRTFLDERGFMEVETPMMQVRPGGALARPFVTHHNALDMDLFLRIAPELYLKRLVVGGFEQVYEINRNFRNEGLSTRHNPEFTMLEFYEAYADYHDLMDKTEELLRTMTEELLGTSMVEYQGEQYDFGAPFARLPLRDAVLQFNPKLDEAAIDDRGQAAAYAESLGITIQDDYGLGKIQLEIYEKTVEHQLKSPTFVIDYPAEVSPLARRSDSNPFVTDRFELIIGGREIANGFSELNDYEDQAKRLQAQVDARAAGDDEAMEYDEDFVEALEYGMPPTAGEGIGIDRLVMLLTDSASIRDVLLFPHMRVRARD
jgi:lysyl-tRNA synthetase, class II